MRKNFNARLGGCSAFLAVCMAAQAQTVTESNNPNAFASDYTESFESFTVSAPNSSASFTAGGLSILGGAAVIQAADPTDGTTYAIYDATTTNHTATSPWALGAAPFSASVYNDGGYKGLGFELGAGGTGDIKISLTGGATDTYFGGYFQSALSPSDPNSGNVTFDFYNAANQEISGTTYNLATDPVGNAGGLVGVTFTTTNADPYSYVIISGDSVAVDSLRVAHTAAAVPEPGTYASLGLGLGVMGLLRRRR